MNQAYSDMLPRARALHEQCVVIDTHVDTTQRLAYDDYHFDRKDTCGHVDLPRLREGGISALVMAVYAPKPEAPGEGVRVAREQIARIHALVESLPNDVTLARTAEDVRTARKSGKLAILIGIEGGYLIEESLDVLREFREAGAIYMTLTHAFHTTWADSSGVAEDIAPLHGGLTQKGREIVGEMERLGMMIDISHVSDDTTRDVLEVTAGPIIASHSSCKAISPHRRNLSDEMLTRIAERDGVCQVNFVANFIDPDQPWFDSAERDKYRERGGMKLVQMSERVTPLSIATDHVDHAMRVMGAKHVGYGSDFDGAPIFPENLADCSQLPNLTASLLARGHSEDDVSGVLGENFLRVMETVQSRASASAPAGGANG